MNLIVEWNNIVLEAIRAVGKLPPTSPDIGRGGSCVGPAAVLKNFTGSDDFGFFYSQDVPLKADPGEPVTDVVLHWPTFTSAAQQAGESRLYGGTHFYEGNAVGLDLGEKVGAAAYARAQALWSGA